MFHLGVAVADRPEGPFVPQSDPIRGSYSIDPSVFKDDDGSVYIYFGGLWGGQLQRYRDNKALESAVLAEATSLLYRHVWQSSLTICYNLQKNRIPWLLSMTMASHSKPVILTGSLRHRGCTSIMASIISHTAR